VTERGDAAARATDGEDGGPRTAAAENGGSGGVGWRTLRHGRTVAVADVRRVVRTAVDARTQVLAYLLVLALFAGGGGYGAYLFGDAGGFALESPVSFSLLDIARGALALLWTSLAAIVVVRAVGARGTLANDVGVLSVVPTRDAALGQIAAEATLALAYVAPLVLAVAGGYAVGAGSPTLLATAPVVAVVGVASAVAVAYPVGLAVRHAFTRIEFVARNKTALVALAFVGYVALVLSDWFGRLLLAVFEPLQRSPAGWLADVLLLGVPGAGASALRAAAALAAAPLVAVAGVAAATRVASVHWFADPVLAGSDDDAPVDPDTARHEDGALRRFEDRLAGAVGRPGAAVAVLAWKRAVRAPLKLLYAAYPLLFAVGAATEVVRTGEVPALAAPAGLVFLAWAGAAVFTLNPLGDQGAVLPAAVLSAVDGRSFVAAHVLAGLLVTAPVGTVAVAALAVLSPLPPDAAAAAVAATPASVLVGACAAVGVGMAFPRYEAVNVTRSTKAVVPSLLAFLVFSLYLLATALAAGIVAEPGIEPLVAGVVSFLLPFGLSVAPDTVGLVARGALVPLAVAPAASLWYAVRRFDRVTVDD